MSKKIITQFEFIFLSFILWRVALLLFASASRWIFPIQDNFLGGGFSNYIKNPLFWGWANFDGEHYISIAQNGYGDGEQAFFPLYPLLIKVISSLFSNSVSDLLVVGLLISHGSFFIALVGLYKLVMLDYSEKVARLSVILALVFPTSFYFVSVYTEGLFLALIVWSFYLARTKNWLGASLLGLLAASTRVIGILMFPTLLLEAINQKMMSKRFPVYIFIVPLGLLMYMYYLMNKYGDPLLFIHSLSGFGEQRSTTAVILPQVFYRYFVKILPNLNYSFFPNVFTTFLELVVATVFLFVSVAGFLKLRLSYAFYLAFGFLIPTLSGSFSSLPRYVIVLFPAFLIFSVILYKNSLLCKIIVLTFFIFLLLITTSLFVVGYWVS